MASSTKTIILTTGAMFNESIPVGKTMLTKLGVLVNNAGIANSGNESMFHKLKSTLRTNAAGPYATVKAFTPLLSKSLSTPCIVNVSSGAGSITLRLNPEDAFYKTKRDQYQISKAAPNMVTACQITEYHPRGWKVLVYRPGWTERNFTPRNKTADGAKPTSEGAVPIVRILNGERDAEAGKHFRYDGEHPW
ncbi:hypothetical protein G6011_08055 [Alternaria panax]|uniref:Uncharacterized protein n=1 Tax=Alternaria panax TaxID=48097 RepID=A0AAD4F9I3_9PLEO|nr:hypothetical protein G6011_08055 [Alternaria panax]